MEHDRWSWFAGGVVLGLLIGAGVAGGYGMAKVAEAREEIVRTEAESVRYSGEASRVLEDYNDLKKALRKVQQQTEAYGLAVDAQSARAEKAEKGLKDAEETIKNAEATIKTLMNDR